ncbi:glycoside hydrolase family 15 protein [Pseudactinotalea sp. HY160]|uniref:glycoside hydrolase family 15 protein n=1 Tax=Pseudactinotalea sp. HY160 TaxID=2654490 RepID=UPI00128B4C79|nr:glycoside hydrolase family 15 protein [Pseudactinotalea sp. HY160]MPV48772.1 glycoside hydrolase family 15 protein [Pseudactinotalea sp. HY160]
MSTKAQRRRDSEEFPPHVLREYALLADGQRGALIGPRGDIAWMCMPRWDSGAVFSSLIGGGGKFAVTPSTNRFVWGGYYEDATLIWRSRWVTTSRILESREALAFPGDAHTAVVLRRVVALDQPADVDVVLDPRADFGSRRMRQLSCDEGVWTARCGTLYMRFLGAPSAEVDHDGALRAHLEVAPGAPHDLVLELSDEPLRGAPLDPDRAWAATGTAWQRAVPPISGTIADGDVRQSYAVLRGLTSPGGGMVAGATMSLPERVGQGRNYDYRYAWIRDQSYAGEAVAACGAHPLLDDAVSFVSERILADGPRLKPAYTITGGPVPGERSLDLAGYPGGADKVGNWANEQFQLDAFGEALSLFAAAARLDRLDTVHWRAVEAAVTAIRACRMEPDAGIWELDERRWAHSRLSCVAGLRAVASAAPARQGSEWTSLADSILADVSADCLHPSGRWQRAPGDDRVDAALLIPAIRGALPADDPRTVATLAGILEGLAQDHFMYRFRHDQRRLGEAEGAFLLCGFMTSLALHRQGREVEAGRWFERNRAACGPPGLYSEEYDTTQRQMRGNLPQAFVHALMMETARALADPWTGPRSRD